MFATGLRLAGLFCLSFAAIPAAAATLNFDTSLVTSSYTESGMTIEAMSDSNMQVALSGTSWGWELFDTPWYPEGEDAIGLFRLSTGSLFDLVSTQVIHLDLGEPMTFTGYRNGAAVSSAVIDEEATFGSYRYDFGGFRSLDYVLVAVGPAIFGDMKLDDLTYVPSPVPLPAALPLLLAALGSMVILRRKTL